MLQPEEQRFTRWWKRGPRTSRHLYFYPTSNVTGVLLFGLILLLGCWAVGVVVIDTLELGHVLRQDVVLGGVGGVCVLLAITQIWRLVRRGNDL